MQLGKPRKGCEGSRDKRGDKNEYKGRVVLVTGGAVAIGSNLCRKLAELNAEKVIILDDLSSTNGMSQSSI